VVHVETVIQLARDDQGHPRLVDQDRVRLVHDGAMERPVHQLGRVVAQELAQVVESGFLRRGVRHVRAVGPLSFVRAHLLLDHADRCPEHLVHRAHPVRVAPGQVIVERQKMDPAPFERLQESRGDSGQRLALAGLHLGQSPLVQHEPGMELHAKRPQPDRPARRLSREREALDDFAPAQAQATGAAPVAKLVRALSQHTVRAGRDGVLQRLDGLKRAAVARVAPDHRSPSQAIEQTLQPMG